uniref:Uncharacterized protein LOC105035912 n=1 Tax=Elaeis guineensis var. tenera TaxID=51953 RepID=A0A6I9QKP2_ELAGV|nr:uncharacterized protein LOC105035912 [Elaeis guineensis]
MAGNKASDTTSPYYLNSSDNPGNVLVSYLFNGDNYPTWSHAMKNALCAKNKPGFVDGSMKEPSQDAPEFEAWDICNSMIISSIFNSLNKSLHGSVAYVEKAKDMWDDLQKRFSQGNAPRAHQIKTEISSLHQEGLTVASYYTKLKGMWDELENYSAIPKCTYEAAKEYAKEKEIHSKEQRAEAIAFHVSSSNKENFKFKPGEKTKCEHCGKIGHEKTKCWELVGYPADWESRRGGRSKKNGGARVTAHAVQIVNDASSLPIAAP